jgi:hypothetical protein
MNSVMIDLTVPQKRHKRFSIPAPLAEAMVLVLLAVVLFSGS